jgi:hypothetical protein
VFDNLPRNCLVRETLAYFHPASVLSVVVARNAITCKTLFCDERLSSDVLKFYVVFCFEQGQ